RWCGVITLISNMVNFDMLEEVCDKDGRYVAVKGRINNNVLSLINVYAPPEGNSKFYQKLSEKIISFSEGTLICGGDWNCVLNHTKDTTSLKRRKNNKSKALNLLIKEVDLCDVWRELFPFGELKPILSPYFMRFLKPSQRFYISKSGC
uniref:Endonuclease/exonuclease/phosphatase domain-containing protein n=1 Tax=Pundamilia nyererei TaxID=303518 RepID=A0A3B4GUR1_9CICH